MYIVAIAWIYVVFMMAITEQSATAGVMTFLLYGVLPLTIVLYLMGTPQRKRNRQRAEQDKRMPSKPDRFEEANEEAPDQNPGPGHEQAQKPDDNPKERGS